MALNIQAENITSKTVLRELITQAPHSSLALTRILDPELPCSGAPILALSQDQAPTIISFDPSDGGKAILSGSMAMEELTKSMEWLSRLYPSLTEEDILRKLRLTALAPSFPDGVMRLIKTSFVSLYTFKALRVNSEIGLLIEKVFIKKEEKVFQHRQAEHRPYQGHGSQNDVMSEEEAKFFRSIDEY